ncbi:MAG: bromoperoxidase [Pseudomonadota bacterium]
MNNNDRKIEAKRFREDAARLAFEREHPTHIANGDEQRFASLNYAMSFTKGLEHDSVTGLVADKTDFEAFRRAIDNGVIENFTTRVRVPNDQPRRQWEAPTAGLVFDLEGPDPQAVTMAPAPALGSDELTFEMAEVYELALLRDEGFFQFDDVGSSSDLQDAIDRLNSMAYIQSSVECCEFEGRPRKTGPDGLLNAQTVFRGSSPGSDEGPYLSSLLLMGTNDRTGNRSALDGFIVYGAQSVDQRVPRAPDGDDYMVDWDEYLDVQRGYRVQAADCSDSGQALMGADRRFIRTPRDLATYVHFDALYQAYLNACLILLGNGTAFDPAFDQLSGSSGAQVFLPGPNETSIDVNAGGFALYGGPHILTLVTEVATRALKAVRFQKFNNHIRLRPEALAARVEKAAEIDKKVSGDSNREGCTPFAQMRSDLETTGLIQAVTRHNSRLTTTPTRTAASTALLPMAFAEGSPMHPAYGAGHATVAGACVTVLKAFFDTSAMLVQIDRTLPQNACGQSPEVSEIGFFTSEQIDARINAPGVTNASVEFVRVVTGNGASELVAVPIDCPLILEGELNKLAANISIGRNMAGVHYFTDYYDSVRMGEEIAIGMLEEQAIGYPTDPFVMSVPTFDGGVERIGAR